MFLVFSNVLVNSILIIFHCTHEDQIGIDCNQTVFILMIDFFHQFLSPQKQKFIVLPIEIYQFHQFQKRVTIHHLFEFIGLKFDEHFKQNLLCTLSAISVAFLLNQFYLFPQSLSICICIYVHNVI